MSTNSRTNDAVSLNLSVGDSSPPAKPLSYNGSSTTSSNMKSDNSIETVQQEIIGLSHKVDVLYQVVEERSHQLLESLSEIKQTLHSDCSPPSRNGHERLSRDRSQYLLDAVMDHKDILIESHSDSIYSHQNGEKPLSAEIQVQRLTAQLTAAYNRIAALEEQLLVRRVRL